ncbi:MAG: sigma-70 family RNA polymerase sigma factor [Anaerolineales bacterium]|nr:sigma-70 family RNA polymerase sigma factor [Anaerolineales bacterium]
MEDETLLIERLQAGNRSAFAELVESYSPKIFRLALKMMGDEAEAEEVLQETFLQVVRHIDNFRGHASIGTWLYRIASNQALMKLRKKQPERVPLDHSENGISPEILHIQSNWTRLPETRLLDVEANKVMERAIQDLPENLRVVFVLRDIEGLSTADTAQTLDLSISAVKSRLLRARIKLRNELSIYFSERIQHMDA